MRCNMFYDVLCRVSGFSLAPQWVNKVFSDGAAVDFFGCVGVHWYML